MRFAPAVTSPPLALLLFTASLCGLLPRPSSQADDTLYRDQSLAAGNQTLVSAGGMFEFGFFTPGNDSRTGLPRYYLGVWYYNITPRAVVWVANRNAPFANSSAVISVRFNGLLVVQETSSNIWWSSGASSASGNYSATIGQDGNLVVAPVGDPNRKVWQSFEHPTATFLPGMTLSSNRTARMELSSWKSEDDPSVGNYSLFLDPRGMYQLLTVVNTDGGGSANGSGSLQASDIWWRSGVWTSGSKTFNGILKIRPLSIFGFDLEPKTDPTGNLAGIDFTFEYTNNRTRIRFLLLPNGTETTFIYNERSREWTSNWSQPVDKCEEYNNCGHNTMCRKDRNPKCSCLPGFELASGNRTAGCVRRVRLPCQGVGFLPLDHTKLPDLAILWTANTAISNESICRNFCLGNCSCAAYAYPPSEGCFTWGGDLIDILQFTDGVNGEILHLKLPNSELQSLAGDEGIGGRKLVAIVVPVVAIFILAILLCLYCVKRRICMKGKETEELSRTQNGEEELSNLTDIYDAERQSEGEGSDLPLFSLETVQRATSDFSGTNTLGKGGFGEVYMGILPSGQRVAVKRLSQNSCQGLEEFKNEMTLIAKLQHNNLVRLKGCCIERDEKILIYEYMANKSLDAFIFDPAKQAVLDWKKRFNIIEGIARGLLYLHRDSRLRIIHRDLKASNILLDQEMNPKISDFGMARIFGGNQNQDNTNRVVGTFGYMSPEYAMEGLFSVKSDVYSFGVLVLEILSGTKNNRIRSDDFPNLLAYAWQLWDEDRTMELVDPSICNSTSYSPDEVLRCVHIALLCVQDRASDRPTMSQVIIMLGSDRTASIQDKPKKPTFASVRCPGTASGDPTPHDPDDIYTSNDVTITALTGR